MIIAFSTDKKDDLDQPVSENFGRSQCFCLYNADTEEVIFIENIAGAGKQNAGIKTINFLLELNVDTVLSVYIFSIKFTDCLDFDLSVLIKTSIFINYQNIRYHE